MITLFILMMLTVFGGMIYLAITAMWGLAKILLGIFCLPVFLILLAASGLIRLAWPILIVVGVLALIDSVSKKSYLK